MSSMLFNFLDQATCVRLTQTLLHFLWQGVVIGLCAALLAWLFRTATARVRYGIHAVSLVLMASLALMTFTWIDAADSAATHSERSSLAADAGSTSSRPSTAILLTNDAVLNSPAGRSKPSPADEIADSQESSFAQLVRQTAPYAVLAYLLGLAAMLGRLCCALWGGHRLRRSALPISDPQLLSLIRQQAQRIGLKFVPMVAYCDRIAIPVVAGVLRPMILLPTSVVLGLDPQQLQIILAHEMAHIRRFDLLVNLVQRVLETVLFFHPAVWYVSRQLSIERENCCDDAVVQAGFERVQYASTLVRVAELCAAVRHPTFAAQLATLAANGGNGTQLKRRVLRLLGDHQRLRLTRADSVTLVLLTGLVTGIMTGAWRQAVASSEPKLKENAAAAVDPQPNLPTKEHPAAGKPQQSQFSGTVVDAAGNPIAGAKVWAQKPYFDTWKTVATSDSDGHFQMTLESTRPSGPTLERPPLTQIAATVDGKGIDWVSFQPTDIPSQITLTLREDVPLTGRLVTAEGQPSAGVTVRILHVVSGDVSHIKTFEGGGSGIWLFPPRDGLSAGGPLTSSVMTDADGRFRFVGLGKERWVRLEIEGAGSGITRLSIVTRQPPPDAPANAAIDVRIPPRESSYYTNFTHAVVPSRTLRGTVLDAETQAPVAGAEVTTRSILGHKYQTDSEGRFEIPKCPKGNNYEVTIVPDRPPYFTQIVHTPDDGRLEPLDVRVAMKRGMIVRGSVRTNDNQVPPGASVVYNPLAPNEHADSFDEHQANPLSRAVVRDDGTYEIAIRPGFGALAVDWKRDAVPSARITRSEVEKVLGSKLPNPGETEDLYSLMTAKRKSSGIMGLRSYKAVQILNPKSTNDIPAPIHFRLAAGHERKGLIVDPDNKPVKNVAISGQFDYFMALDPGPAEFSVFALEPNQDRWLLFYHKERQLGASVTINGSDTGPLTIRLQPCGIISGRFLDKNRKPLQNADVNTFLKMPSGAVLATGYWETARTDSEGRFRIAGMIVGRPIILYVQERNGKYISQTEGLEVESGKVLELGDLVQQERAPFKALP